MSFYIYINNHNSNRATLLCGVPQGSLLGPLLFFYAVFTLAMFVAVKTNSSEPSELLQARLLLNPGTVQLKCEPQVDHKHLNTPHEISCEIS